MRDFNSFNVFAVKRFLIVTNNILHIFYLHSLLDVNICLVQLLARDKPLFAFSMECNVINFYIFMHQI